MKFDYFKFAFPKRPSALGKVVFKPIIPIKIIFGQRFVGYNALIDSGADFSIFHSEIGEALDIDVESGEILKFGGVQKGEPSVAYLHRIKLDIGGWQYETVVGFSHDIARYSYGILGQHGFFDTFKVTFDRIKEERSEEHTV